MTPLVPIGPAIPQPVAAPLKSHEQAIAALQQPNEPSPVLAVTTAKLPPVKSYRSHFVYVSDIPAMAYCNGVHWTRVDTGAVIV